VCIYVILPQAWRNDIHLRNQKRFGLASNLQFGSEKGIYDFFQLYNAQSNKNQNLAIRIRIDALTQIY
jgi:hypothetical protein